MNVDASVAELKKLPAADRLSIARELMADLDTATLLPEEVDAVWADIDRLRADVVTEQRTGPLSEAQHQHLEWALAPVAANPGVGRTWEEIEADMILREQRGDCDAAVVVIETRPDQPGA